MKYLAAMALMLNLATASVYAENIPVRMTFSGTGGASPLDLKQPNAITAEENVAGSGTLGTFTFRSVIAEAITPQGSSGCAGLYITRPAGAAIMRFQDGSLLKLSLTEGGDCIDLVHMVGHCFSTYKIIGGTGPFKNATGVLNYTETSLPVLADALNNPVFFSETGEITGTISGVGTEEDRQDERR